jgi:hypothetical protein
MGIFGDLCVALALYLAGFHWTSRHKFVDKIEVFYFDHFMIKLLNKSSIRYSRQDIYIVLLQAIKVLNYEYILKVKLTSIVRNTVY